MPVFEVERVLGVTGLAVDDAEYTTLAGFVLSQSGRIPLRARSSAGRIGSSRLSISTGAGSTRFLPPKRRMGQTGLRAEGAKSDSRLIGRGRLDAFSHARRRLPSFPHRLLACVPSRLPEP